MMNLERKAFKPVLTPKGPDSIPEGGDSSRVNGAAAEKDLVVTRAMKIFLAISSVPAWDHPVSGPRPLCGAGISSMI